MTGKKGFTLVELLVVIVIIGILVAISTVSWSAMASRGRDSTRKSDLARLIQVLNQYHSDLRSYPAFDSKEDGSRIIVGASWQLNGDDGLTCAHTDNINRRLTPTYLASLPSDPKDGLNYASAGCDTLSQNQSGRYLYISGPTTDSGPAASPTDFGLMATLERPGNDAVENQFNPFHGQGTATQFGSWYNSKNQNLGIDANYLITN